MTKPQIRKFVGAIAVAFGALLSMPASIVTTFVLASPLWGGVWSLGHGAPLLILTVPVLAVGIALVTLGLRQLRVDS